MSDPVKADITAQAASRVAAAMRETAKGHKRLAGQHRRAAQQEMERRAAFLDQCREAGIQVIIEPEA